MQPGPLAGPPTGLGRSASLLWLHLASDIHLGAGDVAVHINATGHHNHAGQVNRFDWFWIGRHAGRLRRDDLTILNPEIANLSVDTVGRIVNGSTGKFQNGQGRSRVGSKLQSVTSDRIVPSLINQQDPGVIQTESEFVGRRAGG